MYRSNNHNCNIQSIVTTKIDQDSSLYDQACKQRNFPCGSYFDVCTARLFALDKEHKHAGFVHGTTLSVEKR